MVKRFCAVCLLLITGVAQAQEDAASAILLLDGSANFACSPSLTATSCMPTSTTQNLGTLPASGVMANDVWFRFQAPAEVVKIRVCNPTFDAAFEVWNDAGTLMFASQNGNANTGASGKEVSCVAGLVNDTFYKVRVGRVSGSGAGTFQLNIEHNAVEVRSTHHPAPPGASCYVPGLSIKRTNTCALGVGSTRWKFVPTNGDPAIICVGFGDYNLASCTGLCLNMEYTAYCEVQANDTECGNIWWGYSTGYLITFCNGACPVITAPVNNATICDLLNTQFTTQSLAAQGEYDYQWRFTTDNGATQFCSNWSTSGSWSAAGTTVQDCFRFGKIYQVQVRARYCDNEPDPEWCQSGITVFTCPMPCINISSGTCCRWRNKNGGNINANAVSGMDQYRFRFTQVDPCSPNPLQPLAPACTTSWLNGAVINPNTLSCLIPGNIYMVQVQARINVNNCSQCVGGTTSIPGQQSDWCQPCFIGFRNSTSPPVGTPIGCYCTPNMPELEDDSFSDVEEFRYNEGESETVGFITANTTSQRLVAIDLSQSMMEGDGVLRVYNMNGQLMHQQNVMDVKNNNYFTLDIEQQLATGVYIVSITTDSGTVTDKIFIGRE